jgi:hypothetical protein
VEITSLHIPSSFALVAGPLVLWFLLLTLLSHVRHANELSSAESEILYSFGWEPLYDATIARVLAFSSVVLLPTLASLLLLIYAPSLTRPIWISALIETVLVVITALIVWLALCRIQRSNPALNAT